ncbi:MAG: PIN domain-containing protein [Bryobacteraceae bacterium]|jgi:predicted nucleic acid-binding protein
MANAAAWLLDTNILLRMSKSDDPHYPMVRGALRALVAEGARLCFTSQILGEFWNASTRPRDRNGFGLSTAETDRIARVIERDFEFLPDSRDVHDRWRRLLIAHDVKGVQVHDARLAASMYVYGVTQLLTVNVRDFQRFEGLCAIHPSEVTRPTQQR